MKAELQPCYILHHRPYRETSLILDIFSLQYGRVTLFAKGAKRGRRPLVSILQPARRLHMTWTVHAETGTLTAAEADGPACRLSGSRLFSCLYMNELLVRLLHRQEAHQELFYKYEESLRRLEAGDIEDRVLRIFEKHLLKSLGYGLILDQETGSGVPIDTAGRYFYRLDSGPVSKKPENARGIDVSGKTLLALHDEANWDKDIAREAKLMFRVVLDTHLGEKPLGSRDLYRAYLQNRTAG